jgi:thiamine-monophosphate kinase
MATMGTCYNLAVKVAELGEFGLIDLLADIAKESQDNSLVIGIGDDAAAWRSQAGLNLVSVDCLVQDVHFSLATATWRELGWKALAAGLSDMAAMGGRPRYALVSLGLPDDTEVEDVAGLYRGMIELDRQYNVTIIGGNISRAAVVFIDTTTLGEGDSLLTRSAATAGDTIAITGSLGTAVAGLAMLTKKLPLDEETSACLRQAFFQPNPRIAEGQLLVEYGVKAAIDISDGLLADLGHLCRASRVGASINIDDIPINPAVKEAFGNKALEMALSGGEDYELLFTAGSQIIEAIKEKSEVPITVIGEITADETGRIHLVDEKGRPYCPASVGWQHFTTES